MKTQKGITLIALIITIIVMLILVGVSVSVALNTGLFKSAQTAAKNTQLAIEEETELSNGTINIEGTGETGINDYVASLKGGNEKEYIPTTGDPYIGCYAYVDGKIRNNICRLCSWCGKWKLGRSNILI